jgi:hypothetical protein
MDVKEIITKIKARKKSLLKIDNYNDMIRYIKRRFKSVDIHDIEDECRLLVIARWINRVQTNRDCGVCAGCIGRYEEHIDDSYNFWLCPFKYYESRINHFLYPNCPVLKFCSPMMGYSGVVCDSLTEENCPKDFIYPLTLELCRDLLDYDCKYDDLYLRNIYDEVFK